MQWPQFHINDSEIGTHKMEKISTQTNTKVVF